ncbi:hypothetical protein T11_8734 [Trichinella zimbabwensis]|uniref:Uncharacterized protein n=1 Tax=Trichinella zimbabwensis TaxID=268475 RepID=A0A0V1GH66_9BILA|nr:hypothetical protein T11_8734 [Trichinella zimbabwensis]
MSAKLFEGKSPRYGQNSGGVDFVEGKRHGAEKKPLTLFWGVGGEKTALGGKMGATLFGESLPGTDKIQVVWILWRENGTVQKGSLQGSSGDSRPGLKKWKGRWWGENGIGASKW